MNLDDIRKLDKDDLLELLGLQRKRSRGARIAETFGTFGLGLLVGAGIALAFAPKPGRELRDEIRDRLQRKPSDGEGRGAGSARGA